MSKHVAIYLRVSGKSQEFSSQESELRAWAKSQETPIRWYHDKFTGLTMDRPGMASMLENLSQGKVEKVVVWRLDRLGRTAAGLVGFLETMINRKVGFLSLRDGLDLSTPSGRLMAHVLSSVAAYETEIRKERQMAGIAAAKAAGRTWGGRKKGANWKVTPDHIGMVKALRAEGKKISVIARLTKLCRPTIYRILNCSDTSQTGSAIPPSSPSWIHAGKRIGLRLKGEETPFGLKPGWGHIEIVIMEENQPEKILWADEEADWQAESREDGRLAAAIAKALEIGEKEELPVSLPVSSVFADPKLRGKIDRHNSKIYQQRQMKILKNPPRPEELI